MLKPVISKTKLSSFNKVVYFVNEVAMLMTTLYTDNLQMILSRRQIDVSYFAPGVFLVITKIRELPS